MIEIQEETRCLIPAVSRLREWVTTAFPGLVTKVVLRFVDEDESRNLNYSFRGLDKPTNILSFDYEPLPGMDEDYWGDLVICAPMVEQEAKAQGQSIDAHYAHIVIHGLLHLQGFEHEALTEAERMETLEIEILHRLGYENPYE